VKPIGRQLPLAHHITTARTSSRLVYWPLSPIHPPQSHARFETPHRTWVDTRMRLPQRCDRVQFIVGTQCANSNHHTTNPQDPKCRRCQHQHTQCARHCATTWMPFPQQRAANPGTTTKAAHPGKQTTQTSNSSRRQHPRRHTHVRRTQENMPHQPTAVSNAERTYLLIASFHGRFKPRNNQRKQLSQLSGRRRGDRHGQSMNPCDS